LFDIGAEHQAIERRLVGLRRAAMGGEIGWRGHTLDEAVESDLCCRGKARLLGGGGIGGRNVNIDPSDGVDRGGLRACPLRRERAQGRQSEGRDGDQRVSHYLTSCAGNSG
jgi:hypothetical protein